MKTYSDQVFDDEVLMEFADGTLPENETKRVSRAIEDSEADLNVVSDFEATSQLIQLLRHEILGDRR